MEKQLKVLPYENEFLFAKVVLVDIQLGINNRELLFVNTKSF